MKERKPPVQTWEMMKAMKEALGITALQKIFSVGTTQINRYCRNPDFTSDSERDPVRRLRMLFDEAVAQGAEDVTRSAISYLAEAIGCRVACVNRPAPDKHSLEAECLDDYPALVIYHGAAKARSPMEHPRAVTDARAKLDHELDQTQEAHLRAWEEAHRP
jgi:hypothetical protein